VNKKRFYLLGRFHGEDREKWSEKDFTGICVCERDDDIKDCNGCFVSQVLQNTGVCFFFEKLLFTLFTRG